MVFRYTFARNLSFNNNQIISVQHVSEILFLLTLKSEYGGCCPRCRHGVGVYELYCSLFYFGPYILFIIFLSKTDNSVDDFLFSDCRY